MRLKIPRLTLVEDGTTSLDPIDSICPEAQVWLDWDETIFAYCYIQDGQYWMHLPNLASFSFDDRGEEVKAIVHPAARPEVIWDTYYRSVLPMALQRFGLEVLHASAVHTHHDVVALCGVSMAGKSTIAYGLSRRGYPLWADDAVAFEPAGRCIRALRLPFEFRLRPTSAAYFSQDRTATHISVDWNSGDQVEMGPEKLAVLCVLQREPKMGDGVAVETRRLSLTQAFPAVLAHSYCFSLQDIERKRRMMQHYLDLTSRIPVFEIRFQTGLENIPTILDTIEQVLDSALTEST